ncbi:hypothetical protein VSS74_19905 [Conexibacter stalactiti]|uniref:Uncharacterized protein n=1 Tax=Conexibacter stalactiti TaxID=1940611 RepID=A0ABU4HTH1_9ACTN|nr:hypothetical protein [Conexibacter stalactiti]MDW5596622.1 hypothetical protein [Conexibacter stalactiti]MEC5037264.1 hypothetical protein [Conexibacter stalactiti]
MRNRNLLSLALTAGAAAVLVAAPATNAVKIPRIPGGLPRAPKVTQYRATLDVAGYIEVKSELDDTQECAPGRDVTIEFDSSFESHGGRATRITVINGAVVSKPISNPGGLTHKGVLAAYRETNYCPPARKVELEKPSCVRSGGRFSAILGTDAGKYTAGSDDPAPLAFPVNIAIWRRGGVAQDPTCRRYLNGLHFQRHNDYELSTFDLPITGIVVPLFANDWDFVGLRKGQWLRRTISLGGACDKVLVSKGALGSGAKYLSKCTVRGRIYVAVRRTE